MNQTEQITRHEREIGEIRGKLESLATKDFVREVVQEAVQAQTREMNIRFDQVYAKIDALSTQLRASNEKQQRIIGAADIIKTALPLLISVVTLIVLVISLLAGGG